MDNRSSSPLMILALLVALVFNAAVSNFQYFICKDRCNELQSQIDDIKNEQRLFHYAGIYAQSHTKWNCP